MSVISPIYLSHVRPGKAVCCCLLFICPGCGQCEDQKEEDKGKCLPHQPPTVPHIYGEEDRGKSTNLHHQIVKVCCLPSGRSLKEFEAKKQNTEGGKVNEESYWSGKGQAFAFGLVPILCFLCYSSFSTTVWQYYYGICSPCFITVYSHSQVCVAI